MKTLFMSDLHMLAGCQAKACIEAIETEKPDQIVLPGDIVDVYAMSRKYKVSRFFSRKAKSKYNLVQALLKPEYNPDLLSMVKLLGNEDEGKLVDVLLEYSKTKPLVWIFGNHSGGRYRKVARKLTKHYKRLGHDITFIADRYYMDDEHHNIMVLHSDQYDEIIVTKPWLVYIGTVGYDFILWLTKGIFHVQDKLGLKQWSLAKYIKHYVKDVGGFITTIMDEGRYDAELRGCDVLVCGHTHCAAIDVKIGEPMYVNCGSMQDQVSYVVYEDGEFRLEEK